MGGEISPVEPRYQGQDLLGRPAAAVDDDEVLLDRLGQCAVEDRFDALRVQAVLVA